MARKNYEILDRYGRVVGDDEGTDERGQLRDGYRLRVPMMMRDGMSPLQRSVAEDAAARRVSFDDSAARCQQGPVSCTDRAGLDAKAQAYRQMCADMESAWRTSSPAAALLRDAAAVTEASNEWKNNIMNDREVARVHNTGDPVRDAYLDSVTDLTTAWSRRR